MTEIDFAVSVGARESGFSRFDFGSAPRGASRIQYGGQQISMVEFKLLAKVISTLGEAAQGGEDIDIRISVALGDLQSGSAKLLRLFVEEGYDWNVISSLLDEQVPPYTTSLDAKVPGESIVGVLYSRKRGRWAAIHRAPDGREEGPVWAATEALARRAAGLAGIMSQERIGQKWIGQDQQAQPKLPDKPPRESPRESVDEPADESAGAGGTEPEAEEEPSDWKILF